jgi:glycosyl transferase family 25
MKQVNHSFLDKIIYINLDFRIDRRASIERQLSVFPEDKCIRLSATHHEKGYVGCVQSHIRALELAIQNNYKNVLIVEDDMLWNHIDDNYCTFEYLARTKQFDVIVLGGSAPVYDKDTLRMFAASSTIGYFVNNHYFKTLLTNLKTGLDLLLTFYHPASFCIDQYWKPLQAVGQWYICRPTLCYQTFNFSDTENMFFDSAAYYFQDSLPTKELALPSTTPEFLEKIDMNLLIRIHGTSTSNAKPKLYDEFTRYMHYNIETLQQEEFNVLVLTLQKCITDCVYFDCIVDSQVVSIFLPHLIKTRFLLFQKGSDLSRFANTHFTIFGTLDTCIVLKNSIFPW